MISIIVPVYKVEPYLPQCLESIINQTYKNLEVILVDDGSQDRCGESCDEYAKKDNRIKVFHTENGGLSAARNYGMTRAGGEHLGFVDSDDWIEPDMFELLLAQMEEHHGVVASCGFYAEYPERVVTTPVIDKEFDNTPDLLRALIQGKCRNVVWNKLYRRSCFTGIKFTQDHVYEDISVMYKVFSKATSAISCSKPLYHYRKREEAISQVFLWKHLTDFWLAHKERYDFFLKSRLFENDRAVSDQLLRWCAVAIARNWRFAYGCKNQDKSFYQPYLKEMRAFSRQNLPWFGKKGWTLFLKLSCFMSKFNNPFIFAVLYFINQLYRKVNPAMLYRSK